MTTNFDSSTPLAYTGLSQTANPPTISVPRAPTVNDWQSFNPGDLWRDTSMFPPITYLLSSVEGNIAIWQALIGTPPGGIDTINSVGPDLSGNYTLVEGANITITPGVNSVTIAATGGNVTSVSGTVDQIDVAPNTGACVVSIDPAYMGQISVESLGTIATGTWTADIIVGQYGGTGIANTGLTMDLSGGAAGKVLTSDAGGNATWQPSIGGVSSVTGTVNQIDVAPNTGACVVSIDPAYMGQISIETLGTIATGTWNADIVTGQYGGTGVANTGLTVDLSGGAAGKVLTSDAGGSGTWQISPAVTAFHSINRQVFDSNGVYTPTVNMKQCDIQVVGGGGGGGGSAATNATTLALGAGGGGGGYAQGLFTAAQIGVSKAVTIGAGGAGGVGNASSGLGGGTSSVDALISASGGGGGQSGINETNPRRLGGGGGMGIGGDFQCGGSAGLPSSGMSTNTVSGASGVAGSGGGSFLGGFAFARATGASGNGSAGTQYGGGGAGSVSQLSDVAHNGGAGASGVVVITEYI